MSSYLDEDSDDSDTGKTFSPEDQAGAKQVALESKESGNELFKAGTEESWDAAVKEYSTGVNALKAVGLGKDPMMATVLLNRSATYLALKRYVPALYDANIAGEIDSDNWKAFWRQGVSLMSMTKKSFRCKQAMEAFNKCLGCSTLPENKKQEVIDYIMKAKAVLEQIDAETPMPDMSNCAPS